MMSRFSLVVSALLFAGCSGGGNVTYIKLAPGTPSAFSGTDCPGTGGASITFSGIDGDGTVAIYAEPNNVYFMDLGGGGLNGTLTGSNYSFTGTWSTDAKATDELQTQETITLALNAAGAGFTGTVSIQDQCQSSNNDLCGAGNPLAGNAPGAFAGLTSGVFSTDGKEFSCASSESLVGVTVSGINQIAAQGPTPPSGPANP